MKQPVFQAMLFVKYALFLVSLNELVKADRLNKNEKIILDSIKSLNEFNNQVDSFNSLIDMRITEKPKSFNNVRKSAESYNFCFVKFTTDIIESLNYKTICIPLVLILVLISVFRTYKIFRNDLQQSYDGKFVFISDGNISLSQSIYFELKGRTTRIPQSDDIKSKVTENKSQKPSFVKKLVNEILKGKAISIDSIPSTTNIITTDTKRKLDFLLDMTNEASFTIYNYLLDQTFIADLDQTLDLEEKSVYTNIISYLK